MISVLKHKKLFVLVWICNSRLQIFFLEVPISLVRFQQIWRAQKVSIRLVVVSHPSLSPPRFSSSNMRLFDIGGLRLKNVITRNWYTLYHAEDSCLGKWRIFFLRREVCLTQKHPTVEKAHTTALSTKWKMNTNEKHVHLKGTTWMHVLPSRLQTNCGFQKYKGRQKKARK